MSQLLGWIEISHRVGVWWWTPLRRTDRYLVPDSAGGLGCSCVFTLIIVSLSSHTEAHTSPTSSMCLLSVQDIIVRLFSDIIPLFQGPRTHGPVCHRLRLSFGSNKYTLNVDLRGSNLPQLQEGWGELVSDKAAGVRVTVLSVSC